MNSRVKKSLPEKYQKRTETSLITAIVSASLATVTCYPLDTIRRQMQMKGTPYKTVLHSFKGKVLALRSRYKKLILTDIIKCNIEDGLN